MLEEYENPENLMPILLSNYEDMFVAFLDEEDQDYERYKASADRRLNRLKEAQKKGDFSSPWWHYIEAEINMHSTVVKLKFGDYTSAMLNLKTAYNLLSKNQKEHPSFGPNLKSLGLIHVLIGIVPDNYQWLLSVFNLEGSVNQGLSEMEDFINKPNQLFQSETLKLYCFLIIFADTKYNKAVSIIEKQLNPSKSMLDNMLAANIYYRLGKNNKGIDILLNEPTGTAYHHIHQNQFMLGTLKLYRQDADADQYLKAFLDNFKGKNYVKDAYQKRAWYKWLNGDEAGYYKEMNALKSKGAKVLDCDKKAQEEAEKKVLPHVALLKAQLFFDGGYYDNSINTLDQIPIGSLTSLQQLEQTYRFARNYEGLGNNQNAILYYQKTIENTGDCAWFCPKAALQIGLIYERLGNKAQAKSYFKKALSYKNHIYKNGIDQQAKAGLSRIGY